MISGIKWVSELIETAGGIEVFPALADAQERQGPHRLAARRDRGGARHHRRLLVRQEIRAGEGLRARRLRRDPGGAHGWLREIKSPLILQPGPAALTDGLDALEAHVFGMGGAALRNYFCAASRVRTSGEIIERRDQARPAAQGEAARQHDPLLGG